MKYNCGFVSIIGKPNAGKSSLLNALVGEKVAIVSPKSQTTRNNILGILTDKTCQYIFTDTPGIHKTKNQLDKLMMKNVRASIEGVDVILYLIDGTKKVIDQDEINYISTLTEKETPVIAIITKKDKASNAEIAEKLAVLSTIENISEFLVVSNVTKENLQLLLSVIKKYLPESEEKNFVFEEDLYTDKSVKFLVAEIIREKALRNLQDEIPHGIYIDITEFKETKKITNISADIYCERENHKNIIIGKQGQTLKTIGSQARVDIEQLLDSKVMLKLWVKAKKDWQNNTNFLSDFNNF